MKNKKLYYLQGICKLLPPIVAQKVREIIISNQQAEELSMDFKRRSFTGGYLTGNTKDFHAFRFFIHGYFDWRNIILAKEILKVKKGDFIEVGANIGTETISLAKINPFNNVHAFEPVPSNFNNLMSIKEENALSNLFLYKCLVSDKAGSAYFKLPDENNSGSGHITAGRDESTEEIPVVTLDENFSSLKSCSLILTDVEGFDFNVLMGGRNMIQRCRPFLIIEVNPNYLMKRANISVSYIYKELENMGYKSFHIDKLGLKKVDLDNFITKGNKNWFCIPVEELEHQKKFSRLLLLNAFNPFL